MIEIVERVGLNGSALMAGQLELSFALRQKRQFTSHLLTGEAVFVRLPRGAMLRGGDWLRTSNGALIEVIAALENLLQIEANGSNELARLAYHLGNRHVAVEVGAGFLRIAEDSVLEQMVVGLGASVHRVVAPFEPEAGAYAYGHRHSEETNQPVRIHEYGHGSASNNK